MKAKETLETALQYVTKDRAEEHGDMLDVHSTAARLWDAYLGTSALSAEDVAIMLALLKVARMRHGAGNGDNYVDLAGYAAVAAEVANA